MMVFSEEQPLFQLCSTSRNTSPVPPSSTSSSDNSGNSNNNTVFLERPKRALTSYNYFFQAQRQKMLAEQKVTGKRVGFAGMARAVAAMWKRMDASEKMFYEALAAQDKARHAQEMALWKKAKKAGEYATTSAVQEPQHAPAPELAQAPMIFNKPQEQLSQAIALLLAPDTDITSALRQAKSSTRSPHHFIKQEQHLPPTPTFLRPPLASSSSTLQPQAQQPAMVSMEELENTMEPEPLQMQTDSDNQNGFDETTDLEALREFSDSFWNGDDEPMQEGGQQQQDEDPYAPLDLSQSSRPTELASTMGDECTDFFVNLFSSTTPPQNNN